MGTPFLALSLLPAPPFLHIIPLYPPSLPTQYLHLSFSPHPIDGRRMRKHTCALLGLLVLPKTKLCSVGNTPVSVSL